MESGVLSPPAHRGWCLVQAPRWGVSRAGGAVWGSQIGKTWTALAITSTPGTGPWASGIARDPRSAAAVSALFLPSTPLRIAGGALCFYCYLLFISIWFLSAYCLSAIWGGAGGAGGAGELELGAGSYKELLGARSGARS
jgi:hypothetical protein